MELKIDPSTNAESNDDSDLLEKMSSSDSKGKLSITDSNEEISKKISKAFCVEKDTREEVNPLLSIMNHILFPCFGTIDKFQSYNELLQEWKSGSCTSQYLKQMCCTYVSNLIRPLSEYIRNEKKELYDKAYNSI